MSDNVINISDWRKRESAETPPSWLFDMRAFVGVDGYSGNILSFNDDHAAFPDKGVSDRLLRYADCLDQLSWFLRQQAENMDPSENGVPIATATIWENSMVRVRVNDEKLVTETQFDWLDRRFDDAKEAARPK